MRLAGKSAVGTGGGGGFGEGIARAFAVEGVKVVVADIKQAAAERVAKEIGGPPGRISAPADIANACVFLAEHSSSFITGVLLPVDGGRTA